MSTSITDAEWCCLALLSHVFLRRGELVDICTYRASGLEDVWPGRCAKSTAQGASGAVCDLDIQPGTSES